MSITTARLQLVDAQPFYAAVLQNCLFSWDDRVGTAGVGVDKQGRVRLFISPKFWESLSEEHRVGLLTHEMLHLLMDHLVRGKELDQRMANIAMDIAINQMIPEHLLPNGALLPGPQGLPPGKSFEYYYLELLDRPKEPQGEPMDNHGDLSELMPEDGSGSSSGSQETRENAGQGDQNQPQQGQSQQGSGQSNQISSELAKAAIREAIQKAVQGSKPGDIPIHVQSLLPDVEAEKAKIKWKQLLKTYIGKMLSSETEATRTRPNRRLGFKAQGSRRTEAPTIMIACDESGSMSDEMLQEVVTEAKAILKTHSEKTEVIHFDTRIAHIEKLSKITSFTRHACGGTDFDCVVEYANKKTPDLLIMMTDGEARMKLKPNFPILWLLPSGCRGIDFKGKKIYL